MEGSSGAIGFGSTSDESAAGVRVSWGVQVQTLRILLVTNLYPPQELGGYGRCMSDFCWGLRQRGHYVSVLCSDAPYLGPSGDGPNGENVRRTLRLKGSFQNGLTEMKDPSARANVDRWNQRQIAEERNGGWDAILLGNLDCLGIELLGELLAFEVPIVHHVGFIAPPYPAESVPKSRLFRISPASEAVRTSLNQAGFSVPSGRVVYPGAREDLLGTSATGRSLPTPLSGTFHKLGSSVKPLKVCFAGLLMGSKGAHTVIQALVVLKERGIHTFTTMAGAVFQPAYKKAIVEILKRNNMEDQLIFCGNLKRDQLARMYCLNHVGVFASTYPEAFGIVAAEIQASGLALVSSGVGGAAEVLEHEKTGLLFEPGNAIDLANQLMRLANQPDDLRRIAFLGQQKMKEIFSVRSSCKKLERLLEDRD